MVNSSSSSEKTISPKLKKVEFRAPQAQTLPGPLCIYVSCCQRRIQPEASKSVGSMRSNEVLLSPLLPFQMDEVLTMFQFLLVPSVDPNAEVQRLIL